MYDEVARLSPNPRIWLLVDSGGGVGVVLGSIMKVQLMPTTLWSFSRAVKVSVRKLACPDPPPSILVLDEFLLVDGRTLERCDRRIPDLGYPHGNVRATIARLDGRFGGVDDPRRVDGSMVTDVEVEDIQRVAICGIGIESRCESNRFLIVGTSGASDFPNGNERA